ncbi:MAG: MFS transporter [Bauldia sp.]
MTMPRDDLDPPGAVAPGAAVKRRGIVAWYFFDWATQPVATLITTFVIAVFFEGVIAERAGYSDAEAQSLWAWTIAAAGVVIAVLSPILGSIADAAGRRKPWIVAFSIPLLAGCLLIWLAVPGEPSAVTILLLGVFLAVIGAEFAQVFTNAMMPTLVSSERMGRLSGSGWAMGYLGGTVSLLILLAVFVPQPGEATTIAGLTPLLGASEETREGVRATGLLSIAWFLIFAPPLLLFTPDAPRAMGIGRAVRSGLASLRDTFGHARRYRTAFRFLIAHMIYADGLAGLFAIGAVYAAGTFDWGTTESLVFGMIVVVAAVPGAFFGGRLDDRLGSKAIIVGSLALLFVACLAALSVTADRVLFFIPVDPPVEGDGMFASMAERLYLVIGAVIGVVSGPLQAASRTMIVKLAPPGHTAQFFGLFALSGKLTTFLAAAAIALATAISDSQRIGISVLLAFFLAGLLFMRGVRAPQ